MKTLHSIGLVDAVFYLGESNILAPSLIVNEVIFAKHALRRRLVVFAIWNVLILGAVSVLLLEGKLDRAVFATGVGEH